MTTRASLSTTPTFTLLDDCRYGRFLVPLTDQYVGQALATYGEYSQIELELLLQLTTPGTRVVVCGANLGSLVVPLARASAEVVAFEPQRWVFQLLCANLALNDVINVRAVWGAVGARSGAVRVPVLRPDQPNNFGALELEHCQELPGDAVPVYALDKLPDLDCGLITIDVEGMELDVLRGAEQLITRCRPLIFFEADRALKNPTLFAWLRAQRYDLHWYRTPLFNPDNWRKKEQNVFKTESGATLVSVNVIATPRERAVQLNGFAPVLE